MRNFKVTIRINECEENYLSLLVKADTIMLAYDFCVSIIEDFFSDDFDYTIIRMCEF